MGFEEFPAVITNGPWTRRGTVTYLYPNLGCFLFREDGKRSSRMFRLSEWSVSAPEMTI